METFINLQRFACLWGIMPGSLTDEGSPFNECAHAYLAATRALLMHLRVMPGKKKEKQALVTNVELAMLSDGASLVLCQYSNETFNTAEVIGPRWRDIPFHDPSSMAICGTTMAAIGLSAIVFGRSRTAKPERG